VTQPRYLLRIDPGPEPCALLPHRLVFRRPVTVLVGANGSGKSTVLRTIAASLGLPLGGGSMEEAALPRSSRRVLGDGTRVAWRERPERRDFFSGDNAREFGAILEGREPGLDFWPGDPREGYGGHHLTERSHGEGVGAMLRRSLQADFLLLDEPETALAPAIQLALAWRIARAGEAGEQQIVVATHAPTFLRIPGAQLVELGPGGPRDVAREDTVAWRLHRQVVTASDEEWERLLDVHGDSEGPPPSG
jgi:predicted ATPase